MENKNLLEKIQNELDKNKSNFVNYELLSYVIEKSKQEDEHVLLVAMENGNIYITKYILDTMVDLNDNLMVLDRNGLDALQKGILFGRFYSAKLFVQYLIDYEVFSRYKLKRLNEIIETLEEFNLQVKQLKIGSTYFIDTLKKVIKNYYFDFVVDYFYLLKENNLKKHIKNFIIELKDEKGIALFEIALDEGIESYLKIVESAELSLDTKELQNPFLEISQDTGSYDAKLRKGFIQLIKKEEWHWLYMLEKKRFHIEAMRQAKDEGGNSLIHYAIAQDNFEATEFLKEKIGLSVVLKNRFNQTPIEFATIYKKRIEKENIKKKKMQEELEKKRKSIFYKIKKIFS